MLNALRGVDVGKYQFDLVDTYRADPAAIAAFEETLKSAMPETDDHDNDSGDKRRLSIVAAKWGVHCTIITPDSGARQVFVHVSALRNRALPPQVGQLVSFTLSEDSRGRPCAVDVARDGEPAPRVQRRSTARPRRFGSGMTLIGLIFLAAAAGWYKLQFARTPGTTVHSLSAPATARTAAPRFRCDGRTHCSEMNSCAEAKYFIRNCPNTQMDGDGDGVPCESQWCVR